MLNEIELKKIFKDTYLFLEKWNYRNDINQKEWDQIIIESDKIYKDNKKSDLAKEMLVVAISEIGRNNNDKYKEG